MDYARFAALRAAAMDELEQGLETARRRPRELDYQRLEELAVRYRQILHDHALAAARYPGTAVARRLRRLAIAATHWLQRDPADHLPSPGDFFRRRFPAAMRGARAGVLTVTAMFAAGVLVGLTLTAAEPATAAVFLPAEALAGLERGELWTESIFAVMPGSVAAGMIATNNMSVALTGWALGAVAGLGAIYVGLLNGLMLGSATAISAHYGAEGRLLEFIAAHGPLEIGLILVTAGAGLGIGRAWVEAGDRPRAERLGVAGRDGLIVLLGCLPWFVVLGLVEGLISPSPDVPAATKLLLGLALGSFFVWTTRER